MGALIQNSSFAILGVKPNLVLVVILAFGLLEKDWLKKEDILIPACLKKNGQSYLGKYFRRNRQGKI